MSIQSPEKKRAMRRAAENMFGAANGLDTLKATVGHALCAAELGRVDLLTRIKQANHELESRIGRGILLHGVEEMIDMGGVASPKRLVGRDLERVVGLDLADKAKAAGIFSGLELFDRATLSMDDNVRLPWPDEARDRLEICFALIPDVSTMELHRVNSRMFVPTSKVAEITFYEA